MCVCVCVSLTGTGTFPLTRLGLPTELITDFTMPTFIWASDRILRTEETRTVSTLTLVAVILGILAFLIDGFMVIGLLLWRECALLPVVVALTHRRRHQHRPDRPRLPGRAERVRQHALHDAHAHLRGRPAHRAVSQYTDDHHMVTALTR